MSKTSPTIDFKSNFCCEDHSVWFREENKDISELIQDFLDPVEQAKNKKKNKNN